jgi:hypothetical protein
MAHFTVTDEFPDNPHEAYTLAVGFSGASLLGSLSDAAERAHVVDGLNAMVHRTGYALTPGDLNQQARRLRCAPRKYSSRRSHCR